MRPKKILAFILLVALIAGANQLLTGEQTKKATEVFHTDAERTYFQRLALNPIGPGEYFLTSAHCQGCHGYDSAGVSNIDGNGMDVNLFDHWQSTMMANAARDPLWRAKVSHEILVDSAHAAELQDKCTDCHAPMGRYNAFFHGAAHYGLADLALDSLGQDGVSCAGCHTIDSRTGQTFSGLIPYDTSRTIYGPFSNPMTGPMQLYEGYTPTFSTHMDQSRLCASCHTLITQSVDTSGIFTGGEFVEQATYHEYLNSRFPADSITCQKCHMPRLDDAIVIANGLVSLQARFPFNQHVFAGANSFMLTLIKNNKTSLGSTVDDWKFDSSIAATNRLLRDSSIVLQLQLDSLSEDTGFVHVRIQNKAGHKFPSGYPSRRVVIQLVVTDALGDTVFKSGTFTASQRVVGETPAYEPHHDVIRQSDVPQIYELVMGDVYGHFTSVLERASLILKDNRIPPAGFTTLSPVYDTVKISNDAIADPDFNKVNTVEGSGVDVVHYHIPLTGVTGTLRIQAHVLYQSVPPKWLDEMFTYSSAEIDSFRSMYNNADKAPLLVASDSLVNLALATRQDHLRQKEIIVFPTLTEDGQVFVRTSPGIGLSRIEIYSLDGKKVNLLDFDGKVTSCSVFLPLQHTVYLMKIRAGEKIVFQKIIRH